MGAIGFNSGMSDALQKIMEQRLRQKQQEFDNSLKIKEEDRKAAEHAADLEFKHEQLAQLRAQKADIAAEKLQKNIGVGKETTAAQDTQLNAAGLPVSGGVSLPSKSSTFGLGTLPTVAAAPPVEAAPEGSDAPVEPAPAMPAVASAPAMGTMITQAHAPQDQRTHPMAGPRIPTFNVGSAADRQAVDQRAAIKQIGSDGEKMSDSELFAALVGAGYDPDKAGATVRSMRPPKDPNSSQTQLLNPATKNAVIFNAAGANGAGYYDVATHAFVPAPAVRPTGIEGMDALKMEMERVRLEAAKANLPGAADYEIPAGSHDDKIAEKLASGDIQLSDFYALFGRAAGGSAKRREAVLLSAMEKNPNFNPSQFKLGYQFANNAKVRQQVSSLNNVASSVPDLLKVSEEAARTGVPLLNDYINKAGYKLGGKSYANLAAARTAFADELSGALGYGSATDMSREMGFDMTDPNLSPDAFRGVVEDILLPFVARKKAALIGPMGPYGKGLDPAAIPGATTPEKGPGTLKTTAPGAVPSNVKISRDK